MRETDQALWIGLGGLIATTAVYFALRNVQDEYQHIILTLAALLIPLVVAWQLKFSPRDWLGEFPPALDVALSALAGLSIWGVGWWLMNLGNDQLYKHVGLYVPTFARLESWTTEVTYFVVLLPLATAFLIFGGMRATFRNTARPFTLLFLTLFFATLATITTPQGMVSLLGYGLLGFVAAFLSLQTRSLLVGFAPYAGFMYANLAFLDELGLELGGVEYTDTRWLTFVILSLFLTLVLVQVIRFRNLPPEQATPPKEKPTAMGYVALVILALTLAFVAAGELQRRNENSVDNRVISQTESLP